MITPVGTGQDAVTLRVLTYNTHHGANRSDRLDPGAIAQTIERVQPDVVALQEVDRHYGDRSGRVDQPSWYAERLGMHLHYGPNLMLDPDEEGRPREYGLAWLSRHPFTATDHVRYAWLAEEQRGLLTVRVTWNGVAVRLINTHLSSTDGSARAEQIRELVTYVDGDAVPTVVVGDFNARRRDPELSILRTRLTDAWDRGEGLPLTCGLRRIDYIWMTRELTPVRSRVVRSRASDHHALVSDLRIS